MPQPALPGALDVGGPLVAPPGGEDPTTYGAPGADPVSAPVENDGPGATETNFLTPPCREDSDCGDGRRCVGGARPVTADPADAGADPADAEADAGPSSEPRPDAGTPLGRCEGVDGG